MTIYLSLFVALVGLLVYALADRNKTCEVGRILFWTGLLTFLLNASQVKLFPIPGRG